MFLFSSTRQMTILTLVFDTDKTMTILYHLFDTMSNETGNKVLDLLQHRDIDTPLFSVEDIKELLEESGQVNSPAFLSAFRQAIKYNFTLPDERTHPDILELKSLIKAHYNETPDLIYQLLCAIEPSVIDGIILLGLDDIIPF